MSMRIKYFTVEAHVRSMPIRKKSVDGTPAFALRVLREAIEREGMSVSHLEDHFSVLKEAGITPVQAYTVHFSSPRITSRLLSKNAEMAVDLPLSVAIVSEAGRTFFIYRDMHNMFSDFQGAEMVNVINIVNSALERVTDSAVGIAESKEHKE